MKTLLVLHALLLLNQNDHFAVVEQADETTTEVFQLGRNVSYGESAHAFAFISDRRAQTGTWVLDVLDKESRAVLHSWPVAGQLMLLMSGPGEDVVLTNSAAYFITLRDPSLGDPWQLNELTLADGRQRVFTLPHDCNNPRLANFGGKPLVYAGIGSGVWTLEDASRGTFKRHIGNDESPEERAREGAALPTYLPLPGSGVIRLSHKGELRKVLAQDLSLLPSDGPARKREGISGLFPATYQNAPVVGFQWQRRDKSRFLAYADPTSMALLWQAQIPPGAVRDSVLAMPDGSSYFLDSQAGSIDRVSKEEGVQVRANLSAPHSALYEARILSVEAH